jgi:2-keto-4-pentenoate hydratase/2-oxohepta-3-ene-1,7-dioic acid hydratase in catechol pathway
VHFVNSDGRAALLIDGRVHDASHRNDLPSDLLTAIASLRAMNSALPAASQGAGTSVDESKLGAPVPNPQKVIGVGLNYHSHARELNLEPPSTPMFFLRLPSAIAGPTAAIELPSGNVDWEAELVVVIGRRGRDIAEHDAWDHVAGLTCGQDISHRDIQDYGGQWMSIAKSFDTFAPIGPAVVTPDEFSDPDSITLTCRLNGEEVQRCTTSDMVFSVSQLVSSLSEICTLEPGDLIFTGTPPGVGAGRKPPRFLEAGDVLETTIDEVGTMRNECVARG